MKLEFQEIGMSLVERASERMDPRSRRRLDMVLERIGYGLSYSGEQPVAPVPEPHTPSPPEAHALREAEKPESETVAHPPSLPTADVAEMASEADAAGHPPAVGRMRLRAGFDQGAERLGDLGSQIADMAGRARALHGAARGPFRTRVAHGLNRLGDRSAAVGRRLNPSPVIRRGQAAVRASVANSLEQIGEHGARVSRKLNPVRALERGRAVLRDGLKQPVEAVSALGRRVSRRADATRSRVSEMTEEAAPDVRIGRVWWPAPRSEGTPTPDSSGPAAMTPAIAPEPTGDTPLVETREAPSEPEPDMSPLKLVPPPLPESSPYDVPAGERTDLASPLGEFFVSDGAATPTSTTDAADVGVSSFPSSDVARVSDDVVVGTAPEGVHEAVDTGTVDLSVNDRAVTPDTSESGHRTGSDSDARIGAEPGARADGDAIAAQTPSVDGRLTDLLDFEVDTDADLEETRPELQPGETPQAAGDPVDHPPPPVAADVDGALGFRAEVNTDRAASVGEPERDDPVVGDRPDTGSGGDESADSRVRETPSRWAFLGGLFRRRQRQVPSLLAEIDGSEATPSVALERLQRMLQADKDPPDPAGSVEAESALDEPAGETPSDRTR